MYRSIVGLLGAVGLAVALTGCSSSGNTQPGLCSAPQLQTALDTATGAKRIVTTAPLSTPGFPLADLLKSRTDAACEAVVTETFVSDGAKVTAQVVQFRGSITDVSASVSAAIKVRGWVHSGGDGRFTNWQNPNDSKQGVEVVSTKGKGTYVAVVGQ